MALIAGAGRREISSRPPYQARDPGARMKQTRCRQGYGRPRDHALRRLGAAAQFARMQASAVPVSQAATALAEVGEAACNGSLALFSLKA